MKHKYASLLLITVFAVFNAAASVWTIHGWVDNQMMCQWMSPELDIVTLEWDKAWDDIYPDQKDSGVRWGYSGDWSGYMDTLSVDVPSAWSWYQGYLSGPFQGFEQEEWYPGTVSISLLVDSGEYWIDFASDGTVRISSIQPYDFGKWAWDGSVNPSWIEPLAKKGHGKGHK